MNVLVLGGTGAMGIHLCKILAQSGAMVSVTTRKKRDSENGITYIQGNAHDMSFLLPLLQREKWDSIVDFMNYKTENFSKRINYLLEATKQYMFLSSSRVYADSDDPITEQSPRLLDVCDDETFLKTDDYSLAKARQENILINNKYNNWTIIRPYITYSTYRLQLTSAEKESWLYCAIHNKPILVSRDMLYKKTTLTYGYDVASAIASLIGREESLGEVLNITTDESITWDEILQLYIDVIRKKTSLVPKVQIFDSWKPFIGGDYFQVKWDRIYNREFDNKKINKFLNTPTFSKTLPSLAKCLSDFIDNPHFNQIDWGIKAQQDKVSKTWTNLKEIDNSRQRIKYLLVRCGLYNMQNKKSQYGKKIL